MTMTDSGFRIMLSSSYQDLKEHRDIVLKALLDSELTPITMEDRPQQPSANMLTSSIRMVDEADAFIGLIGHRYGTIVEDAGHNPDGYSLAEFEYHRARHREIPISMFVMSADHPVKPRHIDRDEVSLRKLEAWKQHVSNHFTYTEFDSAEALQERIERDVTRLREELVIRATTKQPARSTPPSPPDAMQQIQMHVLVAEAWCHRHPDDVNSLLSVGRSTLLLGETTYALREFQWARALEPELKRGWDWLILAALLAEDRSTADEAIGAAKATFHRMDQDQYLRMYRAWRAALDGDVDRWSDVFGVAMDPRSNPYFSFEVAAGLAATGDGEGAMQVLQGHDIAGLGPLYMCGLIAMPAFKTLWSDRTTRSNIAAWFDERHERVGLPSSSDLPQRLVEWRRSR